MRSCAIRSSGSDFWSAAARRRFLSLGEATPTKERTKAASSRRTPKRLGCRPVGAAEGVEEIGEDFLDVIEHGRRQARIDADEQGVVHEPVGILQAADDAVGDVLERGLAEHVAAEQLPGLHLATL